MVRHPVEPLMIWTFGRRRNPGGPCRSPESGATLARYLFNRCREQSLATRLCAAHGPGQIGTRCPTGCQL